VALFAIIGAFFVFSVVIENRNKTAFEQIETTLNDWETARAASDKAGLAAKEDGYIASLKKIADSNKGSFGGARANMTIAEIYFSGRIGRMRSPIISPRRRPRRRRTPPGLIISTPGFAPMNSGNLMRPYPCSTRLLRSTTSRCSPGPVQCRANRGTAFKRRGCECRVCETC
jgi:hypothetical protein